MAFRKHCCHSLITEDHTDHCLSRQDEIQRLKALLAERDAEIARLREAATALTAKTPCFLTIRPTDDIECCQFCLEDNGHAPGCEWVGLVAALAARGGESATT